MVSTPSPEEQMAQVADMERRVKRFTKIREYEKDFDSLTDAQREEYFSLMAEAQKDHERIKSLCFVVK